MEQLEQLKTINQQQQNLRLRTDCKYDLTEIGIGLNESGQDA